jgi:cytochrome oxidase Cu insertion factor (SCO1/SenC/PrrC family)
MLAAGLGGLLAVGLGVGLALASSGTGAPAISLSNPVQPVSIELPDRIATLPLVDASGRRTDLAALHGKIVVLADFMTSCQEECPITTGALLEVHQALAAAGLLDRVAIVEVSVDPVRDLPSRLAAYAKTFGIPWTLLTGSKANLGALWSWLGVFYERVREGTPPGIDWQTGRPYTYDIDHSDNVFVLDSTGKERALVQANANTGGKLPAALAHLLSADGRRDLADPGSESWTPADMLQAVGSVLGRTIPATDP